MKIKYFGGWGKMIPFLCMGILSGYFSFLNLMGFVRLILYGILIGPAVLSIQKISIGIAVFIAMVLNWVCLFQFSNKRKFWTLVGLAFIWGLTLFGVSESPFYGKSANNYIQDQK